MTALPDPIETFIARWQGVAASELATAQSFVIDLCALLGVDAPHATAAQDYMFERPVSFRHGDGGSSPGRIDCYRRGAFVLEAKKVGAGGTAKAFDDALLRTHARSVARPMPHGSRRNHPNNARRKSRVAASRSPGQRAIDCATRALCSVSSETKPQRPRR